MAILALGEFKRVARPDGRTRRSGSATTSPMAPMIFSAPARCRSSASGSCSSTPRSAASRRREAGIIFVAARLLDAFFSPVIGYISDHFHHTLAGQEVRPPAVFHPAGRAAGAELRAHVGRGPELLVLPDHLLLLRARVRDGDHPVRDARRRDVARLQDQGEIRRCAHHLRPDRQHRRAVAARVSSSCGSAARNPPSTSCTSASCSRCSSCSWRSACLPIHLGAAARRNRRHRTSHRERSPFSNLQQLFEDLCRHTAHSRLPAAPRHVPRRLHQPGHPQRRVRLLHRVRAGRHGGHHLGCHHRDGDRAARLRGTHDLAVRCASIPRLRIASR